jgi:CHC2 zinc finger
MRQAFHRVEAIDAVIGEIARSAAWTDVFVGVVARARRGGGRRDLVERASVLWVDCDTPAAAEALDAFGPAPSIVVASGGRGHRHAYWLLAEAVVIDTVARANRRLAGALGADLACSEPARILRPAGSAWHKSSPPVAVRLLQLDAAARHAVDDVVGRLDDVPVAPVTARPRGTGEDPLLAIAPAEYVELLTGRVVGRNGKVRCPFHEDRTPSLHVFDTPERGWFCFGC